MCVDGHDRVAGAFVPFLEQDQHGTKEVGHGRGTLGKVGVVFVKEELQGVWISDGILCEHDTADFLEVFKSVGVGDE